LTASHCYNDSAPGAPGLTVDEASRCVDNLPDPLDVSVGRIIISGGEVLCLWCDEFFTKHAPELLLHGAATERGAVDLPAER
jgi:hypothetical protein